MNTLEAKKIVRQFFKNDKGEPFEMTEGQAEIFIAIFTKENPRVHIQAATRYGKSEVISMAVDLRAATYPEKWIITAGNSDKARIIVSNCIKHLFDNDYFNQRFMREGESDENIRRYRNKDHINFNLGNNLLGEIFVKPANQALGFGAPNIIEDEAALISTHDHALVMRMLGDQPDNFLCKVGNPWPEEHFIKSFEDPSYKKIIIDYSQGIREGRYTPAYIDEMRKQPMFDVLYACKFPPQGQADEGNWVPLLTRDEIQRAFVPKGHPGFGVIKLGVDVAGGGRNFSVIVKRQTNVAKIDYRANTPDTMIVAETVLTKHKEYKMNRSNIAIDKVGIGKGVYDIVNRQIPGAIGFNAGDRIEDVDPDNKIFINKRAQVFWKAREWIINGGKLEEDEGWFELSKIKYRTKLEGTQGKLQIMPKEMMLKDGIESPDIADALSMTFAGPDYMMQETRRDKDEEETMGYLKQGKGFNPANPFPEMF